MVAFVVYALKSYDLIWFVTWISYLNVEFFFIDSFRFDFFEFFKFSVIFFYLVAQQYKRLQRT